METVIASLRMDANNTGTPRHACIHRNARPEPLRAHTHTTG